MLKRVRVQHQKCIVYAFLDPITHTLVRVRLGGDYLDITDKLSDVDKQRILKKALRKIAN